jgi:hypothetical protein
MSCKILIHLIELLDLTLHEVLIRANPPKTLTHAPNLLLLPHLQYLHLFKLVLESLLLDSDKVLLRFNLAYLIVLNIKRY